MTKKYMSMSICIIKNNKLFVLSANCNRMFPVFLMFGYSNTKQHYMYHQTVKIYLYSYISSSGLLNVSNWDR